MKWCYITKDCFQFYNFESLMGASETLNGKMFFTLAVEDVDIRLFHLALGLLCIFEVL